MACQFCAMPGGKHDTDCPYDAGRRGVCGCEIYETCPRCRGTDRDMSKGQLPQNPR